MDRNNNSKVANSASVFKIYPSRKNEISQFIKENAINFQEVADVKKLLEFCSQKSE
jgi:trehalose-6-phosphate synthase